MKLYYMKRDALEKLKIALNDTYIKYFTEPDNNWMKELIGEDPFVELKEIRDFDLAAVTGEIGKGEVDFINCKILYENLSFLTESEASDERLWAGLCNSTFYDYMRKRWGYDSKEPEKKDILNIKSRFFFSGGTRSGMYRNTLSKCWWVGRNTYDPMSKNHFKMLDIIGKNDISSKISDIFYNNNFSSNPTILKGIINGIEYFNNLGVDLNVRDHIRPAMQMLNAEGGSVILDCLDTDDIEDLFIDYVLSQKQGLDSGIIVEEEKIDDNIESTDMSQNNKNNDEEEGINTDINLIGCVENIEIKVGDIVVLRSLDDNSTKRIRVNYIKGTEIIPTIPQLLIGRRVGDKIIVKKKDYIVDKIE